MTPGLQDQCSATELWRLMHSVPCTILIYQTWLSAQPAVTCPTIQIYNLLSIPTVYLIIQFDYDIMTLNSIWF